MNQGDVVVVEENSPRSTEKLSRVDEGPNGKTRRQPEEIETA